MMNPNFEIAFINLPSWASQSGSRARRSDMSAVKRRSAPAHVDCSLTRVVRLRRVLFCVSCRCLCSPLCFISTLSPGCWGLLADINSCSSCRCADCQPVLLSEPVYATCSSFLRFAVLKLSHVIGCLLLDGPFRRHAAEGGSGSEAHQQLLSSPGLARGSLQSQGRD